MAPLCVPRGSPWVRSGACPAPVQPPGCGRSRCVQTLPLMQVTSAHPAGGQSPATQLAGAFHCLPGFPGRGPRARVTSPEPPPEAEKPLAYFRAFENSPRPLACDRFWQSLSLSVVSCRALAEGSVSPRQAVSAATSPAHKEGQLGTRHSKKCRFCTRP